MHCLSSSASRVPLPSSMAAAEATGETLWSEANPVPVPTLRLPALERGFSKVERSLTPMS